MDQRIDSQHPNFGEQQENSAEKDDQSKPIAFLSEEEMQAVYAKLKLKCLQIKAAVLSFIDPYVHQFIDESRSLPIIPNLFETGNVDLDYPELLRKCVEVTLDISDEDANKVELNKRDQASGSGLLRHRAGRIGASESHAEFHTNIAQPSHSLIKTIC